MLAHVMHAALFAASLVLQEPARETRPEGGKSAERKPWIGVSLKQEEDKLGIGSVVDGSPAGEIGLRAGDVIVAIDDTPIGAYEDLKQAIAGRHPGDKLRIQIRRGLKVALEQRGTGDKAQPRMGVMLEPREDDEGASLFVSEVEDGGPAERAGLRAGDQLVEIEGRRFEDSSELLEFFRERGPGSEIDVRIARTFEVKLGAQPSQLGLSGSVGRMAPTAELPQEPRAAQPAPAAPRAQRVPGRAASPEEADLRDELRRLSSDLRDLRSELKDLRRQLEQLRSDQR